VPQPTALARAPTRRVGVVNYAERKLDEEYEKLVLKRSYGKREYSGTVHSDELQINGNTIAAAKQFKCFGSIVQENSSSVPEIGKSSSETRVISMLN
jgi:hypothetical protein